MGDTSTSLLPPPLPYNIPRMRYLICFTWAVLLLGGALAAESEPLTYDFGPIVSRQADANGEIHLKVLGPLFEHVLSKNGDRYWGVRPFYSQTEDAAAERQINDFLWPIAGTKQFRDESSWRVLLAYGQRFDSDDPESRYRVWILPFYFQGRDTHGEEYAALFPIGGKLLEFLWRDRITFLLFPLMGRSSINEVETRDWLWPFISRTEGKGIYRFRIFPFYGQSKHRDKFEKKFIMWPFWTWARYHYPGSSGTGYIVFPLWGHIDLEDQESWLFLPPLFRFHKGQRQNFMYCPWPFFVKRSGEVEQLSIWPIWGKKTQRGVQSSYLLWPIFWKDKVDRQNVLKRRVMAMPFVYWETERSRPLEDGEVVARYHKLWPLVSYRREKDVSRLRLLELWPLKDSRPIEANWAPWWTLFNRSTGADSTDTEFLWGLYRSYRRGEEESYRSVFPLIELHRDDSGEGERSWSLLKGLIGWKREGSRKSLRLLYFLRFGGSDSSETPAHDEETEL